MSDALIRGANAPLQDAQGVDLRGVILGVDWTGPSADVNLFAILCGPDRRVRGEGDFLFWGQPVAHEDAAFLLDVGTRSGPPSDRGQVVIDLAATPEEVHFIHVVVGAVDEGNTLDALGSLRARALNAHTGEVIATYENRQGYTDESCVVVWEIYRRQGRWKLRAVDQGWRGGIGVLANTYGVDVA